MRWDTSGDPDDEHEPGCEILEQRVRSGLRVGRALIQAAEHRERVRSTTG